MNEFLAELYGTGDFEKLAAAELYDDVNDLTEEEIRALAIESLLEGDYGYDEDMEKEATLAEYDFAGRIMAHACADELEKIAEAGAAAKATGETLESILRSAPKKPVPVWPAVKGQFWDILKGTGLKGLSSHVKHLKENIGKIQDLEERIRAEKALKYAREALRTGRAKTWGLRALLASPAAAAAGYGGYRAYSGRRRRRY